MTPTVLILLAAAVSARVSDSCPPQPLDSVRLGGLLGQRVEQTALNRLLEADEEALLAGFRHRPGKQEWIGEHVGKFLQAATWAWVYTGDPRLRAKVDRVTTALLDCQLPDGYLGTYLDKDRWTSWDVWVHKYDLIGLLAVHEHTENTAALLAARRIGDLLVATFGPGKRDILQAGTHLGMAATSVLEPMVQLYRATREKRYLEFCLYLVSSWSQKGGPRIVETLLATGKVNQTANRKAYEMMSNLVGLLELYREVGSQRWLDACRKAWEDIVANQMYLTGGVSVAEHFRGDHDLPNHGDVAENCAQVTFLQLTASLYRLTGSARYAEVAENLVYNHLLASQSLDTRSICYFTPLEGTKPFDPGISCCTSSNPRGLMLIPTLAWTASGSYVYANLHAPGQVRFNIGGRGFTLRQTADYPNEPVLRYEILSGLPVRIYFYVRRPAGVTKVRALLNDAPFDPDRSGNYLYISRVWNPGDRLELRFDMPATLVPGQHGNEGQVAVRRGPLVYAADEGDQAPGVRLRRCAVAATAAVKVVPATPEQATWPGEQLAEVSASAIGQRTPVTLRLRPFIDAGAKRRPFRVWLPTPAVLAKRRLSLLDTGRESWSREGNQAGSINDGQTDDLRVTYNGGRADLDWYAIDLDQPVTIRRVVFVHGRNFHDGGWFDTSAGPPKLEVRLTRGGPWVLLGSLTSYPKTTARSHGTLQPGQVIEVRCPPTIVYGVRVVGVPASGDSPQQAFSSCAELQAFAD